MRAGITKPVRCKSNESFPKATRTYKEQRHFCLSHCFVHICHESAFLEEEVQEDNDEWNYISIGDQKSLGIRTAGLEDKVTACEMIVCYARELKGTSDELSRTATRQIESS